MGGSLHSNTHHGILAVLHSMEGYKMSSTIYTFVCDPNECDSLVEFTTTDGYGFPNGEIKMQCPCNRMMQYIGIRTGVDDEGGV